MGVSNAIEGGYETARLTAAEQDQTARQEREDAARRYLLGRGLDDVAEILGLVEQPTQPKRRRTKRPKES